MASAQQKPKKEKGTRNSKRRNGKALKQEIAIIQDPIYFEAPPKEGETQGKFLLDKVDTYKTARYGKDGNRLTGKGRPRGKSYLGISLKRIEAQANARTFPPGVDGVEVIKAELLAKRERRNDTRKMFGKAERERQVAQDRENAERIVAARKARQQKVDA